MVCGQNFNDKSANLICQEMGYKGAENWTIGQNWNVQNYYETILSEVVCGEDNDTFRECVYKTLDSSDCSHHQDVFLSCISNKGSH